MEWLMLEGMDLCRSPGPIPLLKQSWLEQIAQDCLQTVFKYLQGGRLPV